MLQVIGAGLPRTATRTLKIALQQLTGGPCYHMSTVRDRSEDVGIWQSALGGDPPDWQEFFAGYTAAVDHPASAFWPVLADAFPDAFIVLSTRADAQTWWRSVDATIAERLRDPDDRPSSWAMCAALWQQTVASDWDDPVTNTDGYHRWNEQVRRTAPSGRLLEWQASEGWPPLCDALGVPIPEEPFPATNSTAEFRERIRQRALERAPAPPD